MAINDGPVKDFGPALDATREFNRQVREWLRSEVQLALRPIIAEVQEATRLMRAASEDARVTRAKMEEIARDTSIVEKNYSRLNGWISSRDLEHQGVVSKFQELHDDVKKYIDIVSPKLPSENEPTSD